MPYRIEARAEQFAVVRIPDGHEMGQRESRDEAERFLASEMLAEEKAKRAGALFSQTQDAARDRLQLAEFDLDGEATSDGEYVYRSGKIFAAGNYPDKQFEITPAEMAAAAAAFRGADIDLSHTETVLDKQLGRLVAVDVAPDGIDLLGVTAFPKWLDDVLGDSPRKVSCTWDKATKALTGLALTPSPRVDGAQIFAAFSAAHPEVAAEFARARHDTRTGQQQIQRMHDIAAEAGAVCKQPSGKADMASAHEAKGLQAIHDTAVEHGATCQAMKEGESASLPSYYFSDQRRPVAPARGLLMNLAAVKDKFMALFGQLEEESAHAPEPAAGTTPDPTPAPAGANRTASPPVTLSSAIDPALAAQIAALQSEVAAQRAQVAAHEQEVVAARARAIDTEAKSFADRMIREKRAMPAEQEAITAAFRQAATDDQSSAVEVTFGHTPEGEAQKGGRLDTFRALFAQRPPHVLMQELLGTQAPQDRESLSVLLSRAGSDVPDDEKPPTQERKDYLLSLTSEGKAVLAQRAAPNGKGGSR